VCNSLNERFLLLYWIRAREWKERLGGRARNLSLLEVRLVLVVIHKEKAEERRTAHRLPSCLARIEHGTIEKCCLTMVGEVKYPYISDR
jgi:hypothetical protein